MKYFTLVALSCLALATPAWATPYSSARIDECGIGRDGMTANLKNGSQSSFVRIDRDGGMLAKMKNGGSQSSCVAIGDDHMTAKTKNGSQSSFVRIDRDGKDRPSCDVPSKPQHDRPSKPNHDKPVCDVPEKPHHGKPDKPQHDKPGKPHHEKPVCDNKPHKPHGECDKPAPEPEPEPQPEPVTETVYSIEDELVPYVYVAAEYEFSEKVAAGVKLTKPFDMHIAHESGKVIEAKDVDVIVGAQASVKVADPVAITAGADMYLGDKDVTDYSVGVSAEVMKGVNLQVAQHFGDLGSATTVGIAISF